MNKKIRVLIADDHPVVRKGIATAIENDDPFEIIAQSGDGTETLNLICETKPDIAILDISMPGLSGLEIVNEINQKKIPVKFIILTMYKDEELLNRALNSGVLGYVLKDNAMDDILHCLKAVSQDKHFICPELSEYLIDRNSKIELLYKKSPSLNDLTSTEKRILKLIAENQTSKQIADDLCVSIRTIQNHRNNICNKLSLKGYNKLLQFAIENKSLL
jgi:DNA-binding NarL/FixJ family response regulator